MKNYKEILSLKVFNMQDVNHLTHNINSSKSIIQRMLKNKYIQRVKYNLYAVCDLEYGNVIADQYMISSKIQNDSFVSYHSAFDYYGVKNQVFYIVYVSSKKKFEDFDFDGYSYEFIKNKYDFGIIQKGSVRITDKERTVLDNINRTDLAGGNEELIMCLELMGRLDNNKIKEYLKYYNSKKLYAKVGFVLEKFKESLGIEEETITECHNNICNTHYYFDDETKRLKNKFISKWNLIVPEIYLTRGEGIYW
ncbi:MAG: hypothetical protein J6A89_02690 [Clostridia bacterium]|nr:hypothetical protein [Clostridia bacterium]